MNHARWTLFAIFIAISAACLAQQTAPAAPAQPASAPPVRDPHSNAADLAVPLCPATFNDSLATDGIAGSGDKTVKPPVAKHQVEPEFSDELRRLIKGKGSKVSFIVEISLVVDAAGKPQDACLFRSAGYGLDAQAAKAVQQYEFAPATLDGKPVAERITIEVNFATY